MRAERAGFAVLALTVLVSAPAYGQYQWFENFEDYIGPSPTSPWQLWTERGTNQSNVANENEEPDLGNIAGFSDINRNMAFVGGNAFNGGIYQVITLPLGAGTYQLDGFWRSSGVTAQNAWAEVIIVEGNSPPTNGSDLTGPLHYKNDTFGGGPTWDGMISSFTQQGGATGGTFTTGGTITLVLKAGNGSGASGTWYDDISITPEPTTAAMAAAALFVPLLMRRRVGRA